MKITKSRLLQIIKEEVEIHHANRNNDAYSFDVSDLVEMLDEEEVSKKKFDQEIEIDQHQRGNEPEENTIDELAPQDQDEDQILTKKKPHKVILPKHQKK